MCSIGILGFVVWSQWLAFPIREDRVINSTVGWNGYLFLFLFIKSKIIFITSYIIFITSNILFITSNILFIYYAKLGNLSDTFYSLNSDRNAQSAGNLSIATHVEYKKGSSETIRGNTYDLFKLNFAYFFKEEFKQDDYWLSWFVGFLEGDGAILEHKGRSYFVLTQKDDIVLHQIYEVLKIGKVKDFYDKEGNRKYSRYIVSDNKGIFLLYLLLNGNLVLQSRVNQLSKWYIALSNASRFDYSLFCTKELPKKIETLKEPSLNDAWLSGFTDAEGCFSVKIGNAKVSFYVSMLFILDQKYEEKVLNKIGLVFTDNKKAVLRTSKKRVLNDMFRLTFNCNDKKKIISSKIINYFNLYKLKTTKKESFRIWTEIIDIVLNKQPLSDYDLKRVRKLRHNMNYFTIQNLPKGQANKS